MYLGKLKSTTSERCHHKRFGHVSGLVFRIVCKDRCILIYTCIHTHIYIYMYYIQIYVLLSTYRMIIGTLFTIAVGCCGPLDPGPAPFL
jgi:hypothetical protein